MQTRVHSALFLAPDISPLSRGGEIARAVHAYARALASLDVEITVCAPRNPAHDPEALGLARWIEPLNLAHDPLARDPRARDPEGAEGERGAGDFPAEVAVFEGALPSGGGRLFLIDGGGAEASRRAAPRAAVALAKTRLSGPEIVHATDGTAEVLRLAERELGGAATILTAVAERPDARGLPPADRAVAPSSEQAKILAEAGFWATSIPPGIDEGQWSPSRDPHLPAKFSASDLDGKDACKRELQRELGLPPRAKDPLIAALPPLGGDTLTGEAADALAQTGAQLAFLLDPDSEDPRGRQLVRDLAGRYPTRVAVCEGAPDGELAHRLAGGADFALYFAGPPPRGMSRLHALAYGAVPIAPRTGEFADRLVDVDPLTATGSAFFFPAGASSELVTAARRAIRAFHDRPVLEALRRRAMSLDLSWRTAAHRYLEIYGEALRARRTRAA